MLSRTVFFSALFLLLPLLSGVSANVVDRSVAVVNDDTITLSEVNEFGQSLFKKVTDEVPADRREAALQEARLAVIDKLIEKKLIIQEAKKLGIQVNDQEVETAFQRILANSKTTEEQFRKDIAAEGMSEKQYREGLREQILSSKLINHEVRTKVVIADSAVRDYYNTHYLSVAEGGEYYLQQIGCIWGTATSSGTTPSQEEAKQKIEKAHALASKGKDFKELAKEYSDLPSATEGGDLGHFQQDEMASFIRDAVIHLKPGEISRIVEHDNAYHFFKLVSHQQGQAVAREPFDEVKEQIREKLYQQALEQRFKDWLISIREKAYIKIL
ncbi:SurA N-terminal domain-containing protein [Desulfobulbus sp.]|uniref:peptidylprolyl isomerase n=1 Tax=Desulfobulbus sp. TaxID=895 RepID=UPI00286FA6AE|nr:SurA N-terminal domain-containing protein [Desulfobulbus sp.]